MPSRRFPATPAGHCPVGTSRCGRRVDAAGVVDATVQLPRDGGKERACSNMSDDGHRWRSRVGPDATILPCPMRTAVAPDVVGSAGRAGPQALRDPRLQRLPHRRSVNGHALTPGHAARNARTAFRPAGHRRSTAHPRLGPWSAWIGGDVHLQPLPLREGGDRKDRARRARPRARRRGCDCDLEQRSIRVSGGLVRNDAACRGPSTASDFRMCSTKRRKWPAPTAPSARRTSSASIAASASRTGADSTTPAARRREGNRRELYEAMVQTARTGAAPAEQHPAIGCSIKWKSA